MNISSRGRYGLRAMCELAMSAEETKLSLRTIASNQDLPLRYMEHLLRSLNRQDWLNLPEAPKEAILLQEGPRRSPSGKSSVL